MRTGGVRAAAAGGVCSGVRACQLGGGAPTQPTGARCVRGLGALSDLSKRQGAKARAGKASAGKACRPGQPGFRLQRGAAAVPRQPPGLEPPKGLTRVGVCSESRRPGSAGAATRGKAAGEQREGTAVGIGARDPGGKRASPDPAGMHQRMWQPGQKGGAREGTTSALPMSRGARQRRCRVLAVRGRDSTMQFGAIGATQGARAAPCGRQRTTWAARAQLACRAARRSVGAWLGRS